ncbi:acyl-CoA dehydrogenase family protein [Actinomadura sp. KC345]|uniref:acyl-CoA dehydrogenase family protein n=1 Tax=Actinomadura sp. KC345 TaxID=2530371 RepID=UPI001A9EA924|nr:acyl-CoA dehydrogenase family protein [Actinomadura sp. KC345]
MAATSDEITESLDDFLDRARHWLESHAKRRDRADPTDRWGEGSDSVALFQNMDHEQERAYVERYRSWLRAKSEAGLAHLSWEREWGGRGLPSEYERAYDGLEREFDIPGRHEVFAITLYLIAPTIRAVGTPEQKRRHLGPMLRGDELWCQLFSEPGAGSDLAGVTTRATRADDGWIIDGQKVWTSGAQFADWGYALCRTGEVHERHGGLTAFIVPMSAPGVEVRPLRQASGGASFNEVFLTGVEVPDDHRLGAVGTGWRTASTTLGFERSASAGDRPTGMAARLLALAERYGAHHDPAVRQLLVRAHIHERLLELTDARLRGRLARGETPGPEGSIGKLAWTEGLRLYNWAATEVLGQRLVADTGEWGTYAWSEHVLGTAGYRIAGGSDEIQRNIIAERMLGLPRDPRSEAR